MPAAASAIRHRSRGRCHGWRGKIRQRAQSSEAWLACTGTSQVAMPLSLAYARRARPHGYVPPLNLFEYVFRITTASSCDFPLLDTQDFFLMEQEGAWCSKKTSYNFNVCRRTYTNRSYPVRKYYISGHPTVHSKEGSAKSQRPVAKPLEFRCPGGRRI
jgi:hypothetical protein